MEDSSFFFRSVSPEVRKDIADRKTRVGELAGARRRSAFVEIYNSSKEKVLPKIGTGFEDTYSSTTGKPIPTLGQVTIEMDGEYGSLRRATAEFTCYDMESFNQIEQSILRPGTRIYIRYGYLGASLVTETCQGNITIGDKGKAYEFVIYDYSFTYTKQNNIKCSFKAVGPGVLAGSVNFGNSVETAGRDFLRDFEEKKTNTPVKTLEDVLDYDITQKLIGGTDVEAVGIGKTENVSPEDGYESTVQPFISMIKLPSDYEVADAIQETNWFSSAYAAYCSLSYIVHNLINKELFKNSTSISENFKKIRYVCNKDVSSTKKYSKYVFSADPLNVAITGTDELVQMRYGTDAADAEESFNLIWMGLREIGRYTIFASNIDCSNILISRFLLRSLLKEFKTDKFSISDFFTKLFAAISDATGGMITLGLYEPDLNSMDADEQALYNKYSMSGAYTPILIKNLKQAPNAAPTAVEFDPMEGDGITRSCEVSAKVPKDMAAEAFGRNAPGSTGGTGTDGGQISQVINKDASTPVGPPDDARMEDLKSKTYPENKLSGTAVEDGKAFLKDVMNKTPLPTRLQSEQILYPLEMKLTLDGIEGFRFGDHVTTTNIPAVYKKSAGMRVGFTVLRTTHTISANDWSTELVTIARLINK